MVSNENRKIIMQFNDSDVNIQRSSYVIAFIVAALGLSIYFVNLYNKIKLLTNGEMLFFIALWILLLLFIMFFIHERIHYIALRIFSKQKPITRLTSTILAPKAHISKMQGLISYLLPFLVVTLVLILIGIFMKPYIRYALLLVVIIHAATCHFDFLFAYKLLKCNGDVRLAHEKPQKGIDTIIFNL